LKTTIEIPDGLFRRAKSAAAERGVPLRALVTEALADKLRAHPNNDKPWMKGFGKLADRARGSNVILDTNGLSALADGDPALAPILRRASSIAVPVIALGEYRYGIRQSRDRARYERWLAAFIPAYLVLGVDETTAERYAEIREELKRIGRPIPSNDLWIAALARQHALPLLSRDQHFDSVPGVKRVGW
jgi:predicted nucleic acid-binding protein